jgi:hypothetical protein
MSEAPDNTAPTFEQAKRCPKCDLPGEDMGATPTTNARGMPVKVHSIFCRNPECKWFNTSWIIQINPDGSIPKPYEQLGRKQFPKVSPEAETKITESIQAQIAAETQPGGAELNNPYSS